MNIAVRYFSKSGNTEKLAKAIANAAGCTPQPVPAPVSKDTDILFLGAAVYWGGISPEVKRYIRTLDKNKIGKVAVFSTSALAERAFPQIQKELTDQGFCVLHDHFYCRGQFQMLHRSRPNQDDLRAAREFAARILKKGGMADEQ